MQDSAGEGTTGAAYATRRPPLTLSRSWWEWMDRGPREVRPVSESGRTLQVARAGVPIGEPAAPRSRCERVGGVELDQDFGLEKEGGVFCGIGVSGDRCFPRTSSAREGSSRG